MAQSSPKRPEPKSRPAGSSHSAQQGSSSPKRQALPVGAAVPAAATVRSQRRLADRAVAAGGASDEEEDPDAEPGAAMDWISGQVSWLVSLVVHVAIVIVLALWFIDNHRNAKAPEVVSPPPIEEPEPEPETPKIDDSKEEDKPQQQEMDIEPEAPMSTTETPDNLEAADDAASQPLTENFSDEFAHRNDLLTDMGRGKGTGDFGGGTGTGDGNGLGGRGKRRAGSGGLGATRESEEAVEMALRWLANHQMADGSWNFDHRNGACQGRCDGQGTHLKATRGATGLAILPFLGAGYTHLEGKYAKTVYNGLMYLIKTGKVQGNQASWHEDHGTNYSHGLVTLALCEAYAMSLEPPAPKKPAKNPSDMTEEELKRYKAERERQKREKGAHIPMLGRYAQLALNYIMNTQHGQGGWRYSEGQAGDTSVVGWMLMALKSGHMAKLQVRPRTVAGCSVFLKSVQGDDYGSIYHYTAEKKRDVNALHATTAIGLLCRMYMGWDRAHPGITEGVQKLSNWNYSSQDMYYDYYATQVMSHYGSPDGALWKKWNTGMRDYLVEAQVKQENHMKGSWMFTGGHGASAGGRLYNTAMGCMILEVYYRYMPIYGKKSIEENLENPGDAKGEEKGKEKKEKK